MLSFMLSSYILVQSTEMRKSILCLSTSLPFIALVNLSTDSHCPWASFLFRQKHFLQAFLSCRTLFCICLIFQICFVFAFVYLKVSFFHLHFLKKKIFWLDVGFYADSSLSKCLLCFTWSVSCCNHYFTVCLQCVFYLQMQLRISFALCLSCLGFVEFFVCVC